MRRKNWISKKKLFYDNLYLYDFFLKKISKNINKHRSSEYLFKIFFIKNKVAYNLINYNLFFLKYLIIFFKMLKKKKLLNVFYKPFYKKYLIISPTFNFSSQFFEYRSIFYDNLKKNKIKGFFIYKNLFSYLNYSYKHFLINKLVVGYNFYILNSNNFIFNKLKTIFLEKEFNKIGKIKFYYDLNNIYYINYYINYNIFIFNLIELYKINLYLYVKFLN